MLLILPLLLGFASSIGRRKGPSDSDDALKEYVRRTDYIADQRKNDEAHSRFESELKQHGRDIQALKDRRT